MFEFAEGWIKSITEYAIKNPSQFIFTVLLILSPFFAISAYLSWKLAKHLELQEKKNKTKQQRISKIKNSAPGPRRSKQD